MLAQFGAVNGFGWKLHDTVGMEILTVPLTEQLRGTLQLVLFVAGSLLLIFVAAYIALSMAFETALVRPLSSLASAADAASRTGDPPFTAPSSAVREIRVLTEALERLRLSLTKALAALAKAGSPTPDPHE
jgi:nitrogen fixation/metabolism regulation signal transduction histidine kinase